LFLHSRRLWQMRGPAAVAFRAAEVAVVQHSAEVAAVASVAVALQHVRVSAADLALETLPAVQRLLEPAWVRLQVARHSQDARSLSLEPVVR
jgi:hypothetical protein